MSLGQERRSAFKGKGCLITGLIVVAAFIGITYYQQYQSRKNFWKQMGELTKDMVRFSTLDDQQKRDAQQILDEMVAKGRDGKLSEDEQKRIVFNEFLGDPCRLYLVLRRTEPRDMSPELRAKWRRGIDAFLFAFGQKVPTKEESEELDKAAPPKEEYTKENRMTPEHVEKIVAAFEAFVKGRKLDPAKAPAFSYDRQFRSMVHRIAESLGHKGFWQDAVATQPASATQPTTTRPTSTQAAGSRGPEGPR